MEATKTSGRGEQRRRLILDTTLRLIADGGVDSVTHRRVADAACIPLGSTTYYFESRDHLLREAFDHYLAQATALHLEVRSNPIESQAALVDYLVELTRREFEDEAILLAEYELTLFAARDAHVAASLHRWDQMLIKEIAKAMKSLGASRAHESAQTILNLMRGYELDRLTRHELDSANFRKRLKVVVSALANA
ncbi:MAG: TetR/AcrR family transcriptional regulator [Pseudomonadales bacterium]